MSRWALRFVLIGVCGSLVAVGGCSSSSTTVVDISDGGDGKGDSNKSQEANAKDEKPGDPFQLPADQTGKMLAKTLPPTALPAVLRNPSLAASSPGPRMPLRLPESSLPRTTVELMRLPAPRTKGMPRPDFVLEETLEEPLNSPVVPRVPSFATGQLARFASEDVSIAPPLPLLATPLPDRIPLDDATMEASTIAVLTAPQPARSRPLAFSRLTRPEPYENRIPLTMALPEETADPRGGAPSKPQ